MILQVFSIYDTATQAYNIPFFMLTVAEARRAFDHMANDDTSKIALHPHDFELFNLGQFNNEDGIISQGDHTSLGKATEYIRAEVININDKKEHTA